MASAATAQSTPAQRWLARLSFVLAGLAIAILVVFAELKSLAMFAVGLAAAVVSVAAAYSFLSRRGIVRWLSLGAFVLAPIAVIVVFAVADVLWVAIVSAGVWLLAGVTARRALTCSSCTTRSCCSSSRRGASARPRSGTSTRTPPPR